MGEGAPRGRIIMRRGMVVWRGETEREVMRRDSSERVGVVPPRAGEGG